MNKSLLLTFVLIISLLTTTSVLAWNSQTHKILVENVYYSMPESLQQKLNLTLMKEASTAPDLVFHDNVWHHYPPSRDLAYKWLSNITSLSDFSYNFGVAAHYISDSLVAPHYISKEDPKLHSKFENQLYNYKIQTECADYNYTLNDLEIGERNKDEWYSWLETQSPKIPEKELEQAQKFLYSIAIQKLNYKCNPKLIYEEKSLITLPKINIPEKELSYPVILFIFIILLEYKLFKKRRKPIAITILALIAYFIYKIIK